jgi:hypothetical protein
LISGSNVSSAAFLSAIVLLPWTTTLPDSLILAAQLPQSFAHRNTGAAEVDDARAHASAGSSRAMGTGR